MRQSWLWIAGLLGGAGMAAYGGAALQATDPLVMPLLVAGAGLFISSLVMLVLCWRASRRRAYVATLGATDAIARWQVYPADMESFRAIDSARARRLWSLANSVSFPDDVPMEGFPIVVGASSLLIADRLYDQGLAQFGLPGEIRLHPGKPGFLEIHSYLPTDRGRVHVIVARIPVPAAARAEGEKAFDHLNALIKPADRTHIHRRFAAHFEATEQGDDSPHRLQRRRKWLVPALALLFAAILMIIALPRLL